MSMVDELNIQISADVGGASASISGVAQSLEDLGGSAGNAKGDMSDFVAVMSGIAQQMQQFTATIAQAVSGLTSFGGSTADLDRFAVASERASTSLTSMSDAAIYTSPRIGMMGTAAEQTRSELQSMQQGLQGALGDIRSFSDNLGNAGKDAADAAEKIKKLSEELPKLKTAPVTNLEAAFKKLKGTVAALGIGKFLKDSNDAYVVQMQNELKLTAHMKQRMNATDEEIQSIKELASAQQKLGVIGDEIQLAGAQQLTTYAKQSSTLKMLIPAMNDLIAQNAGYDASVGDAASAADMLGRALNGQYTALKRQGVMFTEAQEQILKYGTESQKAQVLVDAIGDKVGNMNELLANTPTGKLKQLQNDFGDFQEQLGATFQPLISSIVPVLGGLMDALREPIINVSRGISIIGQAIASIDSPAVRGIALAAAGIAVLNKLRAAIGGPLTLLLTLGVTLAGLVGSTAEQTDDIGAIVKSAYDGATNATDDATDAAKDYEEELGNVQKAVSKLAGFDTITKLSGGSGALANALVGDNDFDKLYDFTSAAKNAAEEAKSAFEAAQPTVNIDFRDIGKKIKQAVEDVDWGLALINLGDAVHNIFSAGLGVVDGIFGSNHQDAYEKKFDHFFKVGEDIYKAVQDLNSGDELGVIRGIDSLCRDIIDVLTLGLLSDQINDWDAYWQHVGGSLHDLFNFNDDEVAKKHGLYTPENTDGIINRFSPIEGAPMAAYYKWGSTGMPSSVPKTEVTSTYLPSTEEMNLLRQIERQLHVPTEVKLEYISGHATLEFPAPAIEKNNNFHDTAPRSTGIVPSEAQKYINVEVKNYINDEQVNSDYTTRTNG